MAILKEYNLIVEIKFTDYEYGWVYYEFRFFLGELPVFNPNIHHESFFSANEHRNDSLIPVLEEALLEDRSIEWEPTEPDMWIDIEYRSKRGWKHYKPSVKGKRIFISDEHREKLKEVDRQRREAGGKLPDDCFSLTFFVDAARLKQPDKEAGVYCGDGIALRITVTREKLERFVKELKADYQKFLELHKDKVIEMHRVAGLQSPI